MNYTDKLNKLKNNLDGLENKSKDELIEFITWVINMSIAREEGNRYADSLAEIARENEKNELLKLTDKAFSIFEEVFKKIYDQQELVGYKFDDFIEKLKNGELKIIEGE